nr:cytochrome P450 712K1 [Tripterygium hypoglaucum]
MATITDIQYYVVLFFLWLFSTLLLQYAFRRSTKGATHLRLPPSPPSLPVVGHIHLLSKDIHICFQNLARKYGPLLYLRFGSFKCLLISSASVATEVFKSNDVAFSSKPFSCLGDRLIFGNTGFIISQYGDYWRYMKKLTVTELLGARQLERSRKVRQEELHRYLQRVFEKAGAGEVFDVGSELMKLTNNTICRMVLSTRCSEDDNEAEEVKKLVEGSFDLAMKMTMVAMSGPLKKVVGKYYEKEDKDINRRCDELLERMWKEHEERAKREGVDREDKDFMDILLEAYYNDKAEFKITRNQVKAFILDIFIAGTSTSADTMQWVMANLINHPDVLKKVRQEIESVVGNSKRVVEESDLPNFPYLQAVVKETLRLYPPGPVLPRRTNEDRKVSGFDIPKDLIVAFNVYAIMRDPEAWDKPNEFIPERFLSSTKEQNTQLVNFMAFGAGRRLCPGSTLALTLMNTAIANMVQCFDWKVGIDGDIVNMKAGTGFTLALAEPLMCRPVVRFNPFAG